MDSLQETLQAHFGFSEFRAGQREVLEHLLAGRSAAAVFPTGGGKSLCYQLPALTLPGVTLVVSPLIALMKDQIDALAARGIAARRLDSTLSVAEYREVMEQLRSGDLRLLYVAPERFNNERFRESLARVRVSLFAVDEAHCISEWGHNFRPDYLKLAEFARVCGAERVLALTATATGKVLEDICRVLEIDDECAVRTGFYRSNLTLLTTTVDADTRDELLLRRLRERPPGPTIVYVTLQRTAEAVARKLAQAGFPARPYHAGMKDDARAAGQDAFMRSEDAVVVATIAFGMGVDKSNIRYVYHYNLPKSLENYSQEVGRAGRDGETSICEVFACADDLTVLENFAYGDTPSLEAVRGLVAAVFSAGDDLELSLYELSAQHDIRPLVLRTLLTYLELAGYLEGGTPFYSSYQFKPLMRSVEILAHFDGPRRDFLARLLRTTEKKKIWFHIDVDRAAAATGANRARVVRALDYLGEKQMLEVKAAGVRYRYRRRKTPSDMDAFSQSLHERTLAREASEIRRLRQVLGLLTLDGCQVAALAAHFGEHLPQPCGHCSWCLKQHTPLALPERHDFGIDEAVLQQATALQREHPGTMADPRSLARLLCGISSPGLSRAKLVSHPLFGVLEQLPFHAVLSRLSEAH